EVPAQRQIGAQGLEHQGVQSPQGAGVAFRLDADGVDEDQDAVSARSPHGAGQEVAVTPPRGDPVDERRQQLVLRPEAGGDEAAAVAGPLPDGSQGHGLVAALLDQFGGGVEQPGGGALGSLLVAVAGHRHHPASLRMLSRMGSSRGMKASGFSDIGKWPTPSKTEKVEPGMASWQAW